MSSNIKKTLIKKFNNQRVIFWYNEKEQEDIQQAYEALDIKGVEKITVANNEFEIKYRILKQAPKQQFLVYRTGPKPANEDSWLLDLELAHELFFTDQEAMHLQELGLDYGFKDLIVEHTAFFSAKDRREKLKGHLGQGDEYREIRYKLLAVVFNTENISLPTYIYAHATALSKGKDQFEKDLARFNLSDFYWQEIQARYAYTNDQPTIYDFLMEVFQQNFVLGENRGLTKESNLLLSLWKDTMTYRNSYGLISHKIANDTDVEERLQTATLATIVQDDSFKDIDFKIIHELVQLIVAEEIPAEKVGKHVKQRENKYWFSEFEHLYRSLEVAAELIALIRQHGNTTYEDFVKGVAHYADTLYEIDQLYRKFIWHYRKTNQNRILAALSEKVEKVYANDWLLTFNDNWQQQIIDPLKIYPNDLKNSQQQFFEQQVKPIISKGQRLFVIISDALRYECGVELNKRLQAEKSYSSKIDYQISSLPSYTQLCMASLLPHKELTFQEGTYYVEVDGLSTKGLAARNKILATHAGVRATAVSAKEFMKIKNTKTEGRAFVKQYDLIYLYNNKIDDTGDDTKSEDDVFESVVSELDFLVNLVKKIANSAGTNIIITSDHGFSYQQSKLADSDFTVSKHTGEVWKGNRRFVIGKDLKGDAATKAFRGTQLNINSDVDVLIPKSINRLRVSGASSRFIHGGATLQEIVTPLIRVTANKSNTTSLVDIDIIQSTTRITTNILPVSFIQSEVVTETVLPRTIEAAIYAEDGTLLSDRFKYHFDIDEGSERQREVKHRFQLSAKASGLYKNKSVKLVLKSPVEGTSKWKDYREYPYTLNISFKTDFEGF